MGVEFDLDTAAKLVRVTATGHSIGRGLAPIEGMKSIHSCISMVNTSSDVVGFSRERNG